MKETVSFFDKFKNISQYLKMMIVYVFLAGITVVCGKYFLTSISNIDAIYTLATNVNISKEKEPIDMASILKVYPVTNVDNYIISENTIAKDVDKEQKDEEIASNDTFQFDASAVDAISNIITIDKEDYVKKETRNYDRIDMYGFTIYDYSTKAIDFKELMSRNVNLTKKSDPILIYCTHTSESYTNSDNYKFEYSGNFRTKDAKYNMLSVANIISKTLIDNGLQVVFDTTPHDYTSYDNSYTNSLQTIEKNIKENGRFGMIIDVHRDAAADLTFAPKTVINGKSTAQVMIVIGVGYDNYPCKYWEDNLALTLKIVKLGEEMYPGLFRHILVRDARYNQHITPGSILVEVGATGNTLEEAYYGARCFANILSKIYK